MSEANFSPEYRQHIASPEWAGIRQRILIRANGKCERPDCHRRPVHVHHKTYVRLGAELDEDLEALCLGCHQAEHPDHEIAGHPKTEPPKPPSPPRAKRPKKGRLRCPECGQKFRSMEKLIAHQHVAHIRHPKTNPEARPANRGTKRLCLPCDRSFWASRVVQACPKCGTLCRATSRKT